MAVLPAADLKDIWTNYMRDNRLGTFANLTKNDIKSAVDALDKYMSDNAAAINTAIPQPARLQLTVSQKALMLMHVIQKRYLSGV
jgi:hypothetical protein